MKKVWLMGKVRDLDMKNPKPFEDGVNDDLADYNGNNFKGGFETTLISPREAIFHWKLSIPKAYQPDNPDGIPMELWMLITGESTSFQPEFDLDVYTILKKHARMLLSHLWLKTYVIFTRTIRNTMGPTNSKKSQFNSNPILDLR